MSLESHVDDEKGFDWYGREQAGGCEFFFWSGSIVLSLSWNDNLALRRHGVGMSGVLMS
ncbi:hypothetical protein SynA1825c_01640 [Synechococcus sp. A18-25c]|nr:hypothetical protein SynA1825c_01640 [Synechococcus sp. A18-25c]